MVRTLDASSQTAIRTRSAIVLRNMVVITAKSRLDWSDVVYSFWDDADSLTATVVNEDGGSEAHTFVGDGAILAMDTIPMRIGLEVRTVAISLSPLNSTVELMVRGSDPRGAKVEIYRALLDPDTKQLVAAPRIRFLGKVNEAPIDTAAAGNESAVTLRVVSHTRELTRTNPAKKSDAQQQLRQGDRFRRYTGVAENWDVWWGEAKTSDAATT